MANHDSTTGNDSFISLKYQNEWNSKSSGIVIDPILDLDCFWPLLLAAALPPRREGRVTDGGQNVGIHLRHVGLHAPDVCGELSLL